MLDALHSLRYMRFPSASAAMERFGDLLQYHSQQGAYPAMEVLRRYQALWLELPSHLRDGSDEETNALLERVQRRMKELTPSFASLLPRDDQTALLDPASNRAITYNRLAEFIEGFDLGLPCRENRRPRVAIMLPNGPILAVAILALGNRYTMIPMAKAAAPEQVKADIHAADADVILMLEEDVAKFNRKVGIPVFVVHPEGDLTFSVRSTRGRQLIPVPEVGLNKADDVAVLLFTSGTSGKKKLVPVTSFHLFAGAVFTMDSTELGRGERCLNMMPLHHVGGMIRCLYAPMLAGSATICASSFDPTLFWDVVEEHRPTWYYATPTMHQVILAESEHRAAALQKSQIKFIINAGGGLPAALAVQLRDVFRCTVMPSYGMTECAPIASPPRTYNLERQGTSGQPVGPDVAILQAETEGPSLRCPDGTKGRICVRGFPVFPGYLTENGISRDAFDQNGWFDTGDLGLMRDGYLYITGRSKEVINRGGEIISPIEVESAILSAARDKDSILYGRVSETLAFSTPHDVLQEVVGAVIVSPKDKARPDLRQIHEVLGERLQQAKWPVLLVYMDAGVPKSNNKLQRIRLSQRLGLPEMTDGTSAAERHFNADCPAQGTPLTVSIPHGKCRVDDQALPVIKKVAGVEDVVLRASPIDGLPQAVFFNDKSMSAGALAQSIRPLVHGYQIPSSTKSLPGPIPVDDTGSIDGKAITDALAKLNAGADKLSVEYRVQAIFAGALSLPIEQITSDTDFFNAGGDSLRAGRLISELRREFKINLPGDTLFKHRTVGNTTGVISAACENSPARTPAYMDMETPGCEETRSSTNLLVLLLQLIPMVIWYPAHVGLRCTLFIIAMAETAKRFPLDRYFMGILLHIVLVWLGTGLVVGFIAPLAGIVFKWVIIGRYQGGLYPMWGAYHMRWWLVQKALAVAGQGHFDRFNWSRVLYYRMLGARIGHNVTINEHASLGEYDLITLEDNVVLENCIVRPFAVERNCSMLLAPIHIGADSSIGLRSIAAPNQPVPKGTCIGPNSCTWELDSADPSYRDLNASCIPTVHWIVSLLVIEPLVAIVNLASRFPWLVGLLPIAMHVPLEGDDMLTVIFLWFTAPRRLMFHILARIYGAAFGPICWFAAVLAIKRTLNLTCGVGQTGPANKMSFRQKLRQAILFRVIPGGSLAPITKLVGKHYELVSVAVRLLGGKVGDRIYWPSVGPGLQDFDLLEIGNDVVFGSRSYIVTCDGSGREKVRIEDGAMLGDRAVVLSGVSVGQMAMIGSGSLLRRNGTYPADTVWTGSKGGDAIQFPNTASQSKTIDTPSSGSSASSMIGKGRDTTRPFGRAFYLDLASYRTVKIPLIVMYSTFTVVFSTVWRLLPVISALIVLAHCLRQEYLTLHPKLWQYVVVFFLNSGVISAVVTAQILLAICLVIAAKWLLLGRRKEGSYLWDESSYNQRWQFFLAFESLIKDSYRGIGVLPMISGTAYLNAYYRALGAKIGKDCSLLSNGDPNILLTEPDLVTLGERVAVDDASLVCHLNTRGEFELHPLEVGDRSVLRSGSRLLSGARMGSDACLLEHTLVLSGDSVEDGRTVQGWPAEVVG